MLTTVQTNLEKLNTSYKLLSTFIATDIKILVGKAVTVIAIDTVTHKLAVF